jgi:integrator complex subunit 6
LDQQQQQPPSSSHFTQAYPSHHFQQMPPTGTVPVVASNMIPNNGELSIIVPSPSAIASQPMPTSPTGPPPPFPPAISNSTSNAATPTIPSPTSQVPPSITPAAVATATTPTPRTIHNNDLNDAQNISKILQSLHNGSTASTISAVVNHNNDKNHDGSNANNHKEEKLNNEKPTHHRTKRKQQQSPGQKSASNQQQPQQQQNTKKNSSHVHTNGLISDKKSKSRVSNGNTEEDSLLLDDEIVEKMKEENLETRSLVFREIRKMGRDYSGLYEQLGKVKGSSEMRFNFIQMCIDEASRFRRKHMADCIQEWWLSNSVGGENNVIAPIKTCKKKKST